MTHWCFVGYCIDATKDVPLRAPSEFHAMCVVAFGRNESMVLPLSIAGLLKQRHARMPANGPAGWPLAERLRIGAPAEPQRGCSGGCDHPTSTVAAVAARVAEPPDASVATGPAGRRSAQTGLDIQDMSGRCYDGIGIETHRIDTDLDQVLGHFRIVRWRLAA